MQQQRLQSCLQNVLYMSAGTLHWEYSEHGQRKRRQNFQTVFSPEFLQCFIVQFLWLKAGTSHYFVGNMRFNTRPLCNESLTLSLQGAITTVGLRLKYARRIWHGRIWHMAYEGRPYRRFVCQMMMSAKLENSMKSSVSVTPLFLLSNQLWCDSVCAPQLLWSCRSSGFKASGRPFLLSRLSNDY